MLAFGSGTALGCVCVHMPSAKCSDASSGLIPTNSAIPTQGTELPVPAAPRGVGGTHWVLLRYLSAQSYACREVRREQGAWLSVTRAGKPACVLAALMVRCDDCAPKSGDAQGELGKPSERC